MTEHIPRHRADVEPTEPLPGSVVSDFLRDLNYDHLYAQYKSVYDQFGQESRLGGDINRLQMAEIERAYPELYRFIERLAYDEPDFNFANGVIIGAVSMLSTIKSTVEIEAFERTFSQS